MKYSHRTISPNLKTAGYFGIPLEISYYKSYLLVYFTIHHLPTPTSFVPKYS